MSVYRPKRSDGTFKSDYWQYDFVVRLPSGERRRFHGSTGQRTRSKAERVEAQYKELAALGKFEHTLTLDAAAFRYHGELVAAGTDASAAVNLAHLCRLIGGNTPLVSINSSMIAEAVRRRAAEHVIIQTKKGPVKKGLVARATVNRSTVDIARRLLRRAKMIWQIPVDIALPWDQLRLPEPLRARVLTDEERAKYLVAIREDYRAIFMAFLLCGARKAALCSLKKSAVDWERDGFTIMLKRKRGNPPKEHFIPFTPALREIFQVEMAKSPLPYVFTYIEQRGAKKGMRAPIVYNSIRRIHENAKSAAGLDEFRFHDQRHDAATRALRATKDLVLVQRMLGHSDIASTARYAHLLDDLKTGMSSFGLSRNGPGASLFDVVENEANQLKEKK